MRTLPVKVPSGLMKASSSVVEQPAVVIAAQPAFLDEAVAQVRTAVRTMLIHEPVVSALVAVESQVLAQDADRLHGQLAELRRARDRMPVTSQQLSHRSSLTGFAQQPVSFLAQQVGQPRGAGRLIRAAARSRRLTTPRTSRSSSTGRCRKPCSSMS